MGATIGGIGGPLRGLGGYGVDYAAAAASLPATSIEEYQLRQMMLQNMGAAGAVNSASLVGLSAPAGGGVAPDNSFLDSQQAAIQQQLQLIQQLQAQQNGNGGGAGGPSSVAAAAAAAVGLGGLRAAGGVSNRGVPATTGSMGGETGGGYEDSQPEARKRKLEQPKPNPATTDANGVPKTIAAHTHLLELSDPDGSRLRAYYRLSVDELFGFPPTPTDEEYCLRLNIPGMTPRMIPGTHLAALSAARFAEVALGAIVHNEVTLAMELCNAVVHCLKESVQEPVQPPYMFEVARSYFLLGVFRAFRGDMLRYFKYRRVCLTYVSKLEVCSNYSISPDAVRAGKVHVVNCIRWFWLTHVFLFYNFYFSRTMPTLPRCWLL